MNMGLKEMFNKNAVPVPKPSQRQREDELIDASPIPAMKPVSEPKPIPKQEEKPIPQELKYFFDRYSFLEATNQNETFIINLLLGILNETKETKEEMQQLRVFIQSLNA